MENLIIETDRLYIVSSSIRDADLLLKMDKQEETQKYLGGIKNKTKEEREKFLLNKKSSLTVILKNKIKIGFVGINKDKYLSYIFDYDYIGNGYCFEACKALIDYYFLKNDIIYAEVQKENIRSINVLKRLGFILKEENSKFYIYELSKIKK